MKLLFLTGSRGEWGYIRPILRLCQERGIGYHICATNMHLLPGHGLSVNEIRRDGFEISDEIYMALEGGNHFTMVKSLGILLSSFVDIVARVKPDWIVLAGDRGEQLVGAIGGAYTYVPVAHIQAGELSGNIDGMARHAIGKFVHLHFASNADAVQRLRKLGEEEFRIKLVGAPQLDELMAAQYTSKAELERKYDIDLFRPFLLVVQHPVTEEYDQAATQIEATVSAVNECNLMKVWILPNNDAGGGIVREGILMNRRGQLHLFENLPRADYLGFLRACTAIVGNSSSGIIEAPTFQIPAVNLGRRQHNRVQGKNVINAPFQQEKILQAIRQACSAEFPASLAGTTNPYGDGHSSGKILKILSETPRDTQLLCKQLTY